MALASEPADRLAQLRALLGGQGGAYDDAVLSEALTRLETSGVPLSMLDSLAGPVPEPPAELAQLLAESERMEAEAAQTVAAMDALLKPEAGEELELALALDEPERLARAHAALEDAPAWDAVLVRAAHAPRIVAHAAQMLGESLGGPLAACSGAHALVYAIDRQWSDAACCALLRADASPDSGAPARSGLWAAIEHGRAGVVRAMADADVAGTPCDLSQRTGPQGLTPLYGALLLRRDAVVRTLLGAGADPAAVYPWGHALHLLACAPAGPTGDSDAQLCRACVQGLRGGAATPSEAAAYVNARATDAPGLTPFLRAVFAGRLALARALQALGADVHATDAHGSTALHLFFSASCAAKLEAGAPDMARFLVSDCGLDMQAQSTLEHPCTPLISLLEALEAGTAWARVRAAAQPDETALQPLRASLAAVCSIATLDLDAARLASPLLRAINQMTDPGSAGVEEKSYGAPAHGTGSELSDTPDAGDTADEPGPASDDVTH